MSEKSYVVMWKIEVSADSPEGAARKALAIQRDPQSTATCFTVVPEDADEEYIDLTEIDEESEE